VIARGASGPFGTNPILFLFIILAILNVGSLSDLFDFAVREPVKFWSMIAAIVLGITFHEFMHAYSAHRLGDDTARLMGRLTLNPLAHFDLLGSLFLLLLRFGYGKPVPVNEARLAGGRRGGSVVSFAGPMTNLVLATVCALPLRFGGAALNEVYATLLIWMVSINVSLFIFNLLPIPPLDGSRVLYGFLPPRQADWWRSYEHYGPFILLGALFILPMMRVDVFTPLVRVPTAFLTRVLLGL